MVVHIKLYTVVRLFIYTSSIIKIYLRNMQSRVVRLERERERDGIESQYFGWRIKYTHDVKLIHDQYI